MASADIGDISFNLNEMRDVYEGFDLALARAKVAQLFALAIQRNAINRVPKEEGGEETDYRAQVDFNRGPVMLDLDPGDVAQFLQCNMPGEQWQEFMKLIIAAALKSLDIPFSFFDESHTNYSGSRGAWLLYENSAEDKREDLREFLDRWCAWRLGLLIYQGVLELPSGFGPERLKWQWIARKTPWIDPLKEVQAAKLEVDAGYNSTIGVAESMGVDAYELADQQAAYLEYRKKLGLPPPGTMAPIPVHYGEEGEVEK